MNSGDDNNANDNDKNGIFLREVSSIVYGKDSSRKTTRSMIEPKIPNTSRATKEHVHDDRHEQDVEDVSFPLLLTPLDSPQKKAQLKRSPLIVEVSSSQRCRTDQTTAVTTTTTTNASLESSSLSSSLSLPCEKESPASLPPPTPPPEDLLRAFGKLMARLKRQNLEATCSLQSTRMIQTFLTQSCWFPREQDQEEFPSTNPVLESSLNLVLSHILESCATTTVTSTSNATLDGVGSVVGLQILHQFPTRVIVVLVPFLQPLEQKTAKIKCLGAIQLLRLQLQEWACNETAENAHQLALLWLQYYFPCLIQLLTNKPLSSSSSLPPLELSERTILRVAALNFALQVLEWAAQTALSTTSNQHSKETHALSTHLLMDTTRRDLKTLIAIRRMWLNNSRRTTTKKQARTTSDKDDRTRFRCLESVLDHWQCICEFVTCPDKVEEEQDTPPFSFLGQLAGVQLTDQSNDKDNAKAPPMFVGGVEQTLALRQSSSFSSSFLACRASLEDQMSQILSIVAQESTPTLPAQAQEQAIGALTAWLGQIKKLQTLSQHVKDTISNTLLQLLMNGRLANGTVMDMVLACLHHVWSTEDWMPLGEEQKDHDHGKDAKASVDSNNLAPLDALLTALGSNDNTDGNGSSLLNPSIQAVCHLVAHIIQSPKSPQQCHFVYSYVWQHCPEGAAKIEILLEIIKDDQGAKEDEEKGKEEKDSSVPGTRLGIQACEALLDCYSSHGYAQERLFRNPQLLNMLPIHVTVPRLVSAMLLASSSSSRENESNRLRSAFVQVITSILEANSTNADQVVQCILETITQHSKDQTDNACKNKVCAEITGSLRRRLVLQSSRRPEEKGEHHDGYTLLVVAAATAMLKSPSSELALTFFGGILVDGSDFDSSQASQAANALVRLVLKEGKTAAATSNVFQRLAPLLLMRRTPSCYFRVLWKDQNLVKELAIWIESIMMETREGSPKLSMALSTTAEERRIAAELAGRCLPFCSSLGLDSPSGTGQPNNDVSCFSRICVPAFRSMNRNEAMASPKARAALYAMCHHVGSAPWTDSGWGVFVASTYLCHLLDSQLNVDDGTALPEVESDMAQFQRGCIDFFALCIQRAFQSETGSVSPRGHASPKRLVVVEEESKTNNKTPSHKNNDKNSDDDDESGAQIGFSEGLSRVFLLLKRIILNGCEKTSPTVWNYLQCMTEEEDCCNVENSPANHTYGPMMRVCVLNAMILASQRLEDMEVLRNVGRHILPDIVQWGLDGTKTTTTKSTSGNMACDHVNNLHHPLCLAAALQLAFVTISRSQSLDCLQGSGGGRLLHQWAMRAVKSRSDSRDDCRQNVLTTAVRSAALKLVLLVTCVDCGTAESVLDPREVAESVSVVRGIASMDEDPELRKMAAHLLGAIC